MGESGAAAEQHLLADLPVLDGDRGGALETGTTATCTDGEDQEGVERKRRSPGGCWRRARRRSATLEEEEEHGAFVYWARVVPRELATFPVFWLRVLCRRS
jgi:hypothetical protein